MRPYASPEQLGQNEEDMTKACDLFSLGVIMFELMVPCYTTEMERAIVIEALRKGIIPPATASEFPQLTDVLRKLLAQNPDDRPTGTWFEFVQKPLGKPSKGRHHDIPKHLNNSCKFLWKM